MKMGAAVGIGTVGKNGLLFSSGYGARLILGGVVTSAMLPETAFPEKDVQTCPHDCFFCQQACPVGAISKEGRVDRLACIRHSMISPIFSFMMKTGAFESSKAGLINHVTAVDDHSMYTCIRCVSECPRC